MMMASTRMRLSRIRLTPMRSKSTYVFPARTVRSLLDEAQVRIAAADTDGNGDDRPPLVTASGWVRTVRAQKAVAFVDLDDGSTLGGLQVVMSADAAKDVRTGSSMQVTGHIVRAPGRKQTLELAATQPPVIGRSDADSYPLHKARVSLDHLRDHQNMRSRSRIFGVTWRIRSTLHASIHDFFKTHEFVHVNTPVLTAHDCEGGGEAFRIQTNDEVSCRDTPQQVDATVLDSVHDTQVEESKHGFFGRPVYTTVSAQLHAEVLASSLSRVYTLGPVFRAEKSQSTRHLAEFWMLEAEACFISRVGDLADLVEAVVKHVVNTVLEKSDLEDLALLDRFVEPGLLNRLRGVADSGQPFVRMTYTDAIKELERVASNGKMTWSFPVKWGLPLQSEHERYLAQEITNGIPVFVTDYPRDIKPFYMKSSAHKHTTNHDIDTTTRDTVACLDLLVPRVGELAGGSLREDDYATLAQRIRNHGLDPESYAWYLDLRRYGSAPHGGFGIGFERLLAFVTGVSNVRDLIPFPRAFQHCHY